MASRVFAIDLGAWSVKLVVASPGLRGASLQTIVERPVPPPAFDGESAETRGKAVLARLVDEMRLRDEPGFIGVYGDQVFTQVLEFGFKNLRRAELDKAVGGELEGVVPVDLEDMVYCFEPMPVVPANAAIPNEPIIPTNPRAATAEITAVTTLAPTTLGRVAPPAEGMRVLTYAMRRDRAEALLQLGRDCGFEARGILACGGAAAKLVDRTPSLAKARVDGPVAVIDIGHERTDVVVVSAGKAVFSRSFARAGKQVTEAIYRSKKWKMPTWEDAERAKHAEGFIASAAEPATSAQWAAVSEELMGVMSPFARDLRQTLAACRARTGFTPTAAIVVGGGSRLRGMGSFLSEQLGIPTWRLTQDDMATLAGPRIGAQAAADLPVDAAAMTVGMAYEAAGGRPLFDLRSGALAVKVDFSFLRAKMVPMIASALVIAAFAGGAAYADLYALKKADKTLQTRLATESTEYYGEPKTADAILGENDQAVGGGAESLSPRPKLTAYDILLEISNHMPPRDKVTIDVEKLDIDDQKVYVEGLAKTFGEVDSIEESLKKVDCFKEVTRGNIDNENTGSGASAKRFHFNIVSKCM
jgi:Tfp pilus assembly PilM family ATPase